MLRSQLGEVFNVLNPNFVRGQSCKEGAFDSLYLWDRVQELGYRSATVKPGLHDARNSGLRTSLCPVLNARDDVDNDSS